MLYFSCRERILLKHSQKRQKLNYGVIVGVVKAHESKKLPSVKTVKTLGCTVAQH